MKIGNYYIDTFWLIFIGTFLIFSLMEPWMLIIVVLALIFAIEKDDAH
ncbi:MAG: hypothetical protein Q4F01_02545 [Staphylococcus rostri]|nr:hypothetical protein [Staphylococcus rostri]MDO5375042.1 hypothetical protein [Staphylococcus rostri]